MEKPGDNDKSQNKNGRTPAPSSDERFRQWKTAAGAGFAEILDERILFPCVFLSKGKHHQEFSLRLRAGQKSRLKNADDVKKD